MTKCLQATKKCFYDNALFSLVKMRQTVIAHALCRVEHFHFEKALADDGASLVRANEELAKFTPPLRVQRFKGTLP